MNLVRFRPLPVFAGLVLLFALQAAIRLNSSLNHDSAWYVYVAQGLLAGKKVYADFLEVNPPLGMWMTVPPVWLAGRLAIEPLHFFQLSVLGLCGISLALSWKILDEPDWRRPTFFILACAVMVLFLPQANFGEREHLIVLLFMPWVLLRLRAEPTSAWLRIVIGACAACAMALKPQALLAPLLVEAGLLATGGTWRRVMALENVTAALAGLAYILAVAMFAPAFFSTVMPIGVKAYLPYMSLSPLAVVVNGAWAVLFMLLAVSNLKDRRSFILFAAATGFLASYLLQWKGFDYQALPALSFAWAAAIPAQFKNRPSSWAFMVATVVMLAVKPQSYIPNSEVIEQGIGMAGRPVHSVSLASTRLSDAFPAVNERKLVWASRLPVQWITPYVADHWQAGPLPADPIVATALDATVTDLVTMKPDLVIIDQSQQQLYVPGGHFDYLDFWAHDPRFAGFWKDYQQKGMLGGFAIYSASQK